MAKEGKCTRANCEYSHDQKVLDEFKKKKANEKGSGRGGGRGGEKGSGRGGGEALEAACRQEGLRMARCERLARVPLCGPTLGV